MPRDPLQDVRDYYDAIVIGSGLGGLTGANCPPSRAIPCSCLNTTTSSAAWPLGSRGQGAYLRRLFARFPHRHDQILPEILDKEIANGIVQLKNVRFVNPQYDLKTTFDRIDFTRIMQDTFKIAKDRTEAFFEHLGSMDYFANDNRTIGDLFEQFFPGREDIKRLLLEPIAYANGSSLKDPAIAYGIVFSNFMKRGFTRSRKEPTP